MERIMTVRHQGLWSCFGISSRPRPFLPGNTNNKAAAAAAAAAVASCKTAWECKWDARGGAGRNVTV